MEQFSRVKGVGEIKLKKYGAAFLDAIADWRRIHPEISALPVSNIPEAVERENPFRSPNEDERVLLARSIQAKLTTMQMSILLDQPIGMIEYWLNNFT